VSCLIVVLDAADDVFREVPIEYWLPLEQVKSSHSLEQVVPDCVVRDCRAWQPIEYWLPPSSEPNVNACETDVPQCDNQYNDSFFYTDIVSQLQPYTFGAMVWDQAERDVKCPVSVAAYACMQAELATSWRAAFHSPHASFVAVQRMPHRTPTRARAARPTPDSNPRIRAARDAAQLLVSPA
jgi:hypothetical protein